MTSRASCNNCIVYSANIYPLLFQSDPDQVCTEIGLCTSKESKKVDAKLIMSSLPLKKHLKTILAPGLAIAAKPAIIKSKPYRASPQCILCEFVMDKLDSILKDNATEVLLLCAKCFSCKNEYYSEMRIYSTAQK